MALITKSSSALSTNGKVLSLSDTTGNYNVTTNPGGYGASQTPAGLREVSDIDGGKLDFYFNGSTNPDYTFTLTAGTAQGLANGSSTYDLTMGNLGGSSDDVFDDQVVKLVYQVIFDGNDLCQVSQGSNSVTLYSLNDAAGAKYFVIIDGVDEYTYEIISEGSSFVTLDSEVTLTSGDYNYKVIYESTNYLALTHNILKCIHTNIANVACSTCSCKEKAVEKTTEALMQYFGIETNMDKGNYNCAQEIIESLTIYCGKDGCNC
jgi:hypothetical protein